MLWVHIVTYLDCLALSVLLVLSRVFTFCSTMRYNCVHITFQRQKTKLTFCSYQIVWLFLLVLSFLMFTFSFDHEILLWTYNFSVTENNPNWLFIGHISDWFFLFCSFMYKVCVWQWYNYGWINLEFIAKKNKQLTLLLLSSHYEVILCHTCALT